jgi:hypothetical protein
MMEYWNDGLPEFRNPIFHYSSIPSFHVLLVGGFSMRLSKAEITKTAPKMAKDSP